MPVIALVIYLNAPEPAPGAWWRIALGVAVFDGLISTVVLRRTYVSVKVDDRGLHLRDALAVPATELGRIERISGLDASYASLLREVHGQRVSARQNLYGGAYNFGAAVAVEQRRGRSSSWWVLPGPRVDELIAALEASREAAVHPQGRRA